MYINRMIVEYMNAIPSKAIYILIIPIVLIALTVHEVSHGYVAYKLGDPTARNLGRLSLNPLKHIDIVGALCMVIFRFGWAKPVPVNTRYFKKPRRDMALTSLAGPMSNFILAFFFAFLYALTATLTLNIDFSSFSAKFVAYFMILLYYAVVLNISLGVFNFLPIPPLDGSKILYVFLPDKLYFGVMKYEKYIFIALIALLYFGAFTGIIGQTVGYIQGGMFAILRLLPFFS